MKKKTSNLGIIIFLSYSRKDSDIYKISKIAKELNKFPNTKGVLFYEGKDYSNIYKFMNDNIEKCDILLSFCSEHASKSKYVELEWQAALSKDKKVIPIFQDKTFIPALLGPSLGVQFDDQDFKGTIDEIYNVIYKSLGRSETREKEEAEKDIRIAKSTTILKVFGLTQREVLIEFRGLMIPKTERDFIIEMEKLTGRDFFIYDTIESLKEFVLVVEKNNITELSIYKCGLTALPESIGTLSGLSRLELRGNQLTILPESIGNLKILAILDLTGNQLSELPNSIEYLRSLEYLLLGSNNLNNLPFSLLDLDLVEITLKDNPLMKDPDFQTRYNIGNLKQKGVKIDIKLPEIDFKKRDTDPEEYNKADELIYEYYDVLYNKYVEDVEEIRDNIVVELINIGYPAIDCLIDNFLSRDRKLEELAEDLLEMMLSNVEPEWRAKIEDQINKKINRMSKKPESNYEKEILKYLYLHFDKTEAPHYDISVDFEDLRTSTTFKDYNKKEIRDWLIELENKGFLNIFFGNVIDVKLEGILYFEKEYLSKDQIITKLTLNFLLFLRKIEQKLFKLYSSRGEDFGFYPVSELCDELHTTNMNEKKIYFILEGVKGKYVKESAYIRSSKEDLVFSEGPPFLTEEGTEFISCHQTSRLKL